MKYIVGLGNPGLEYENTKHNIGFEVVKTIAEEEGVAITKEIHSSLSGKGRAEGEPIVLFLPQTYMNLSGKAVAGLFREEIKDIDDLMVICDDINLKLGRIRLRRRGSAGGHNGLDSIITALGRNDFTRLRIGIATDIHKGDITNYVLTPFKRKDRKHAEKAVELAKDAVLYWIRNGSEKTMARFNNRNVGTS